MRYFNRRSSHAHYGSKRRELALNKRKENKDVSLYDWQWVTWPSNMWPPTHPPTTTTTPQDRQTSEGRGRDSMTHDPIPLHAFLRNVEWSPLFLLNHEVVGFVFGGSLTTGTATLLMTLMTLVTSTRELPRSSWVAGREGGRWGVVLCSRSVGISFNVLAGRGCGEGEGWWGGGGVFCPLHRISRNIY